MNKRKKAIIITISSIIGVLVILAGTFFIYTSIYYHADKERIEKYLASKDVSIEKVGSSTLKIEGREESDTGIIFYPGAKVEYLSYEPLLASVANEGYTCFLIKMPFNLAIFDVDAASGFIEKNPDIKHWYLAGHSLGGAMASKYISRHTDQFDGLILLGSFPDGDLSSSSLKLLSIYGSNDEVLNKSKYEASKPKWPNSSSEYVIEGGCHSYFGMYGTQKGDGNPTITNEEQIDSASNAIVSFIED